MQREPLSVPARRTHNFYPAFARNLVDSFKSAVPREAELPRKILIVNGHPDPRPERFCAALCDSYEAGAQSAGWQTSRLNAGMLALGEPNAGGAPSPDMIAAREQLAWSNRLVVVFPLWLDRPPELLRALFDRLACGDAQERAAQIVVTMEMPAFAYRAAYRPAKQQLWQTPALALQGVKAKKPIFIGCVDTISAGERALWLETIRDLGVQGA